MKYLNKMEKTSIYTYNELFNLIRIQQEKEKKDKVKPPTQMESLFSEGLRALNNPTSQNFKRTMGVLVNKEEEIPDNRLNYTYRAS